MRDTLAVTEVDQRSTRVVVAEDDVLMREGIAGLLQRGGYEIVGQASDGSELMRLVRERRPDLAVVDIRMPPDHRAEGLDAARMIREEFPEHRDPDVLGTRRGSEAMTLLEPAAGAVTC